MRNTGNTVSQPATDTTQHGTLLPTAQHCLTTGSELHNPQFTITCGAPPIRDVGGGRRWISDHACRARAGAAASGIGGVHSGTPRSLSAHRTQLTSEVSLTWQNACAFDFGCDAHMAAWPRDVLCYNVRAGGDFEELTLYLSPDLGNGIRCDVQHARMRTNKMVFISSRSAALPPQ